MSWWSEGGRALRGELASEPAGGAGVGVAVLVGVVLVGLALGLALARRRVVYTPVEPATPPKPEDVTPLPSKDAGLSLRGWLQANKSVVKPSWLRDVEAFVDEYGEMEQHVARRDAQNAELQQRVDLLEATLRKCPQTPVTCASLGTTRDTETPPTSEDTVTPRPEDEMPSTDDDSQRPRSADAPAVPSLRLPAPPLDAPCAESPRFIRPTEKQATAEATKTFTPLFDEKSLSTPRTLMELVSSHRLTKESLQQRINRRTQQAKMQSQQLAACRATLPEEQARADAAVAALSAFLASPSPAAAAELLAFHASRLGDLEDEVAEARGKADDWLAFAYRVQTKLDKEMDFGRLDAIKHPSGVLLKPSGSPPPVALGPLTLPPQKDLSCLAVNPYKVDSWPIEPNSRGGRASGDLAIPPLREAEDEDAPASEDLEEEDEEDAWSEGGFGVRYVDRPSALLEEDPLAAGPAPAPTDLPPPLPDAGSPPPPAREGEGSPALKANEGSPPVGKGVVRLPPLKIDGAGAGGTAIA